MLNLLVVILSLDFGADSIMNKEQEQASKRTEYDLQHFVSLVSQSMAKSAAVRPLGGSCFD